eukprot:536634-Rhodomonas_salina.1
MSKTCPRLCVACTRGKRKFDECDGGQGGAAAQTGRFTPTVGMVRELCVDAALQRQSGAARPVWSAAGGASGDGSVQN